MTANARKLIVAVTAMFVVGPSAGTLFGFGPMGYHDGADLMVRLVAVFLATSTFALAVALAGALYYVNVMVPAPARRPTGRSPISPAAS